jgi:CHAD domain-containing protein
MARTVRSAYPLQTLRDTTKSLEAAILVCLAKPDKKDVHRLRTSTRRIEAQLELLSILPNLPPHKKEARNARRLLKKLRRAAGKVRDLDVERDLIGDEAAGKNGPRPTTELRKEAAALRSTLKQKRDKEATHLQHLLSKHRKDYPVIFKKLLDALGPSESITLTEASLTSLIRDWYAQHTPRSTSAPQDPKKLHDIRKRAKLARYLAESAPKSAATARRMAAHYEDIQQAGGTWHDWLLLHELSASELGKRAHLSERFATHAENSLRAFKQRLAALRKAA